MFNEATTVQHQEQLDILWRYWDEDEERIVKKYLTSLLFARAKGLNITNMISDFHGNKKFELP